ncbi:hypothetical protein J5N97_029773 [Dioscorea zingiberensis]|uniref:rRNA N-glycosylase n=1 Tax=Dioscorea zingiberensis TaxID=325984 RepID=A0A9D5BWK9_9LILI|nr:hypothetical protein J5N97_029773 [Dioscorea zingiberensis]
MKPSLNKGAREIFFRTSLGFEQPLLYSTFLHFDGTGSNPLGLTGGYDTLLKASNGYYLDNVNLGEAVKQLNNPNTTYDIRAKSLIVVLIMIYESLRYTYITEFLAPTFVNTSPSPTINPNLQTVTPIKNWGKLSELLLVREQSPTHCFLSNPPPPEMEIHNYLDAVAVLGILKEETLVRSTLRTTIVDNDEQQYYYPLDESMVEVISVKIDSMYDLYCTIQVTDGVGSQSLYETTRDESVKTKPGEQLILQHNPVDRSILAYDSFTIHMDLKDAGNNTNGNSGVIKGEISWNVTFSNVYDNL